VQSTRLANSTPSDVLVEQLDRLPHVTDSDWRKLRCELELTNFLNEEETSP
jgi:hypothetical protein